MACLLAAMALFSTIEVASKRITHQAAPLWIAAIRFSLGGGLLLIPALIGRRLGAPRPTLRELGALLALGVLGVCVSIGLYHLSIPLLQANVAAVVFSVNPVFVVLLLPWVRGVPLPRGQTVAALVGVLGILCFLPAADAQGRAVAWGLALMVGALASFALFTVLAEPLIRRLGGVMTMAVVGVSGGLLLALTARLLIGPLPAAVPTASWPVLLYLAIVTTGVAYALFFEGVRRLGAASAVFFFLKPVLASGLAWFVLGETLDGRRLIGTALILGALTLHLRAGARARRKPAPATPPSATPPAALASSASP